MDMRGFPLRYLALRKKQFPFEYFPANIKARHLSWKIESRTPCLVRHRAPLLYIMFNLSLKNGNNGLFDNCQLKAQLAELAQCVSLGRNRQKLSLQPET